MARRRRAGVWRWIGRVGLAIVVLVVLVIAGGAGYEQWARSTARTRFPPPGRLVDVGGGRRIHIDCRGQGGPTVVLISGLDNNGALAWSAVRDRISSFARVCAYDRAGIMYSDPAPAPHDARLSTADLHAALAGAGERGPFVMVGHSLGGPYIDDYVHSYPADVAGIVFVDASHPDQIKAFEALGLTKLAAKATQTEHLMASLTWTGWTRLPILNLSGSGMPKAAADNSQAFQSQSLPAVIDELESLPRTLDQAGTVRATGPHPFGDRPLVVLTALKPNPPAVVKAMGMTDAQAAQQRRIWTGLHDDEARWSTHSRHQLVTDATHYIQFDRPDVVIAAVREVVGSVRGQASSPAPAPR